MPVDVRGEVSALQRLSVAELRGRFAELFGEATRATNRIWLIRRLAWRLQAKAEGDLSERARKRAAELANDADLRLRAPRSFWRSLETRSESVRDPRLPPVGTVLKRWYGERTIEVMVLAAGFEYQGKQ